MQGSSYIMVSKTVKVTELGSRWISQSWEEKEVGSNVIRPHQTR